ncbi:C2H2-type domain-containing protein [Aphelenchoides bicaudatus]|nr:C2H2-type domain-containing protein [Aphelenchoides bicaudatus]
MDSAIRSGCTCMTCRLAFASVELQKQHYSSEWHRYNAKRQVADLPPISEEQFEGKIKARQDEAAEQETEKKPKSKRQQAPQPVEEDEEPERFRSLLACSAQKLQLHLTKISCTCPKIMGFFIPDSNYCDDAEGLVQYLGEKVGCGNFCIKCPNKRFRDLASCQLHMRDKSHCTFSVEGDLVVEYLDFYDYGELLREGDEEEGDDTAIDLGYTLVLPSGAQLGHRALMRYYKQKLRPVDPNEPERPRKSAQRLQQSQLKALGWTGTSGTVAVQRARDFKFMKNVIKKAGLRRQLHSNKLFKSRGRDDQQ